MIELKHQTFYQDGKPTVLLAGEMHYFRIPKPLWETHIIAIKEAGCNVLSTYVPWLIHEPIEHQFEFHGQSLEQYDLISFLTLCQTHKMPVFFRPGPFVMAELHMEGVASYLKDDPSIKPLTFHKVKVPNDQLDYMHPRFLSRVKAYFDALFHVVKPFLQNEGGPIFGIQLDNEIGMLAWVSQSPPLTDDIIVALSEHIDRNTYTFKSGHHEVGHQRLGQLLRKRYLDYVNTLKDYINPYITKDILTFINVHGTGGGRGLMFPIGYAQLIDTFKGNITGTDIYFMDLDLKNAHDYYMINSYLDALKDPETPSTCLEFNGGNSDFGDHLYHHDTTFSMDKKIRLEIISNHKMINYYLFSAGMNPKTHPSYQTANGRIALTGERHGFSAPLKLDGRKTYMYDQIATTNHLIQTHREVLSRMKEVYSGLTVGLMLDQFMTESMRHGTEIEPLKVNLTKNREGVFHETFLKQALLLQYNPQTIHLEAITHIDPKMYPVMALSTSRYMASHIQKLLVTYLKEGGKLLCFGDIPEYNLLGEVDHTLIKYLKIEVLEMIDDHKIPQYTLVYDQHIDGYSSFRTPYAVRLKHQEDAWFKDLEGHQVSYVSDQAIWMTHHYPGDLMITKRILHHFKVKPSIHVTSQGLIYAFETKYLHERFIHVLNFESYPLRVTFHDIDLAPSYILPCDNVMLPLGISTPLGIITANCECTHYDEDSITFKTNHQDHVIKIETDRTIHHKGCIKEDRNYVCHIVKHEDVYTTIHIK